MVVSMHRLLIISSICALCSAVLLAYNHITYHNTDPELIRHYCSQLPSGASCPGVALRTQYFSVEYGITGLILLASGFGLLMYVLLGQIHEEKTRSN